MTRIGIYSGTFDPLHEGHTSFAQAAMAEANLSAVYFLPERSPRHKPSASDYPERVTALKNALVGRDQLRLLELPERALSVHETLPELTRTFPDAKLVLLVGADVVTHLHTWPEIDRLIATCDFVIGMRDGYDRSETVKKLDGLRISRSNYMITRTRHSYVSSTAIRSRES